METKERLLTVALHFTYDVEIECTDEELKLIQQYPKSRKDLPEKILEKIEQAGGYGKLVDDYAEVVEIEECDLMEV